MHHSMFVYGIQCKDKWPLMYNFIYTSLLTDLVQDIQDQIHEANPSQKVARGHVLRAPRAKLVSTKCLSYKLKHIAKWFKWLLRLLICHTLCYP